MFLQNIDNPLLVLILGFTFTLSGGIGLVVGRKIPQWSVEVWQILGFALMERLAKSQLIRTVFLVYFHIGSAIFCLVDLYTMVSALLAM